MVSHKISNPLEDFEYSHHNKLSNAGSTSKTDGATPHRGDTTSHGSLPDQVVNAALNYQIAQPLVNAIMSDAGLGNGSLSGIVQKLADLGVPTTDTK